MNQSRWKPSFGARVINFTLCRATEILGDFSQKIVNSPQIVENLFGKFHKNANFLVKLLIFVRNVMKIRTKIDRTFSDIFQNTKTMKNCLVLGNLGRPAPTLEMENKYLFVSNLIAISH